MKTQNTIPANIVNKFNSIANKHYKVSKLTDFDIDFINYVENDKYWGVIYSKEETKSSENVLVDNEGFRMYETEIECFWVYFKVAINKTTGKVITKTEIKKVN